MKKTIILLIVFISTAILANAQITIDSTDFPTNNNETDVLDAITFFRGDNPKPGINMIWDYGSRFYQMLAGPEISSVTYSSSANSKFKTATRSCLQSLPVTNIGYFTDNASGYAYIGYSVAKRQAIGTPDQWNPYGGSDSLIYQVSDTDYAANPQYIIKYPATYGSSWSYSARLTYHVQFYTSPVGTYGYYNGLEIIHRTVFDSVVGWGKMIVLCGSENDTDSTVAYPVIMVKESWLDIFDSCWVSSLPSYSSISVADLVDEFNLNQQFESNSYTFYRAGYSAPLMKTWSGTTNGVGFDPNNTTPAPTAIKTTPAPAMGLTISPNPFTTTLSIAYTLPQPQTVQLTLTDITGKQIATLASENQNPGPHTYTLNAAQYNIPPGIYFLRMVAGANAVTQKIVRLR